MQSAIPLLVAVSLAAGCSTTRVIEATWDDATVVALNSRSGQTSSWATSDEKFTTRQFFAGTDSLLLKTDVGLGEVAVTDNNRLMRRSGSVHYWRFLPSGSVDEVGFDWRDRGRGFLVGGAVGALAGGLFLGWLSRGMSDCVLVKYGGDRSCHVEAFFDGFLVGVPLGGLAAGLIGAVIGQKRTTVYRFRPDTAQQMSVVIGVGPTATAHVPME